MVDRVIIVVQMPVLNGTDHQAFIIQSNRLSEANRVNPVRN